MLHLYRLAAGFHLIAAEQDLASQYLANLRSRGWHDTVLEYLERADEDPLVSAAFLKRIDFEKAKTQVALAKQTTSKRRQQEILDQATENFLDFAKDNSNTPLEVEALFQVANLSSQRGLNSIEKASRLPNQATNQRQALFDSAREQFTQAAKALKELRKSSKEQIEQIPRGVALQNRPELRAVRTQLEAKQAEGQFLSAKLKFDSARTFAEGSEEFVSVLNGAASEFLELHNDYSDKLIGFFGRLYEGRCYQQLGENEKALECYEGLIDRPISNPEFRRLMARAYRRRIEIFLVQQEYETAIDEAKRFLRDSRNNEIKKTEWLAVAYRLANAYESFARSPKGRDEASRLLSEQRKLLREVSRNPGEFKEEARTALAAHSGAATILSVKTFQDAFQAGKDALSQVSSSQLAARLAENNNPGLVEELNKQAVNHELQAIHYFETCLHLADEESSLEDLLTARYYLCWLYWEEGQEYEAAVIGGFLANRYSENQHARVAAKVSLAAYERMYNRARQEETADSSYESEQLSKMAQLIIARWPESDEASLAMNLLLNIALRDNRLAEAEALLQELPKQSRASAELSLGSSLWSRFLQAKSANDETENLKLRSIKLLSQGYEALAARGMPSTSDVVGLLSLTQALLETESPKQAVEILQHDKIGPLTLVEKRSAIINRPELQIEIYKVALRAFLSVEPPEREEAQLIMEALEEAVSNGGKGEQQLMQIYLSLGIQLQRQIKELSEAGKKERANTLATAFQDVVERVSETIDASSSWAVSSWVAETNLQLGQGLEGEDAARYIKKAELVYRSLLDTAIKDPSFAPSASAILGLRKKIADCSLANKDFRLAFEEYTKVLKEKPKILELQQAAANALHQWGKAEEIPEKLEQAIHGAEPQANRRNLVWGWLKIASLADNAKSKLSKLEPVDSPKRKKYHDLFFAARLNIAKARYDVAIISEGDDRQKQLKKAKQSVTSMQRLYPELGGAQWKASYLTLLEEIESEIL